MAEMTATSVIDLMKNIADNEMALQELYEVFAKMIPDHQDFWLTMAGAEARHAQMVKELMEHAKHYSFRIRQEGQPEKIDMKNSIEHIKLYIEEIKKSGILHRRAIAIAKELEETLCEKNLHTAFVVEEEKSLKLLEKLHYDTEQHIKQIDSLAIKRDQYSFLVERKLVTNIQIELARIITRKEGISLEEALIEHFNIPKGDILLSLSKFYRTKGFIPGANFEVTPSLAPLIREHSLKMKNKLFVPVEKTKKHTLVLMAVPYDLVLRDEISRMLSDQKIEYQVALPQDIISIINSVIPMTSDREKFSSLLEQMRTELNTERDELAVAEIKEEDSIIVKLVNLIVEEAYTQGASDIHIEPGGASPVAIRYRIDGVLHRIMECPPHYRRAIIARIKIMAGLDIAERRLPQSGKISFRRWGSFDIDLRVETYPTSNNDEDTVLRLLKPGKPKPLSDLGLSPENQKAIESLLQKPYGLFLCVGPTGSGKTTTLHSALGILNNGLLKIVTAEDPIEITQPNLRQMQVKPKIGLTFAEALRSFLRADPDVIMIGEMRDIETARIAVEASLTGHLVLSTLHTNTAPETVTRLLDIGIDPFIFSDALLGILAQRLVKKLCPECRKPINDNKMLDILEKEYNNPQGFRNQLSKIEPKFYVSDAGKCTQCGKTGYLGRVATHELLVVSPAIKRMIIRKTSAAEVREVAIKEGMKTLKQDGIEKVLRGLTTLKEVLATSID